MKRLASLLAIASLSFGLTPPAAPAPPTAPAPLPGDSVLRIAGDFTDQSNRRFTLADRRGTPQLIAMFYGSCQSACPLLIEAGMGITRALSAAERERLRVLLVTLDPARDTPAALAVLAREHHVDNTRWTLARTSDTTVRRLAAALDVRYRQLANGDFNHTTAWVLLDANGRILARSEEMAASPDAKFLGTLRTALR